MLSTRKMTKMKISHLKRREVQAPIVSSLIKAFADKIGYDKAVDIAKEVIREDAILSGKTLVGQGRWAGNKNDKGN
jgi:fumarate hydratase class II